MIQTCRWRKRLRGLFKLGCLTGGNKKLEWDCEFYKYHAMKRIYLIAALVLTFGFSIHAAATPPSFTGNWTCVHGGQKIPGALTQRGTQLEGYCIYPGGKRATFQAIVKGNTMSGTLQVDKNTQRMITATISGDTMRGNWSARGSSGGGPWNATRSASRKEVKK